MQRQGGGGNDPSCGCDMQAGWPPASTFPRGGLQGGAMNNFKRANFQFSLTNKSGKQHKYKGSINANNSMNTMNVSQNTMNANLNLNNLKKTKTNNTTNKNKNKNKTNKNRRATSAPPGMRKIAYQGTPYYEETSTGKTYSVTSNGNKGNFVGTYIRPNSGEPYLETPPAPESENEPMNNNGNNNNMNVNNNNKNKNNNNMNVNNNNKNENNNNMNDDGEGNPDEKEGSRMSMEGGRRRRRTRRGKKHGKRCPCFLCMFKKFKHFTKRR